MRFLFLLTVLAVCRDSFAAKPHPIVPAFERFHSAGDQKVAGGRLLLGELNCLSCHKAESVLKGYITPKRAPVLNNIGERIRPDYLREFIANPHSVKPGTTMPGLFSGVSQEELKSQVEALVHFLASTGRPREMAPNNDAVRRGEDLFHRVGCVACHNSQLDGAKQLTTSIPLGDLAKKYSILGLTAFLSDPLKIRPSGRMPNLKLKGNEARDIASYLLKDINVEILATSVSFKYFEGKWEKLPNFSELKPVSTGVSSGFDVRAGKRRDQFGMVFDAFIQIDREGQYTFHFGSDDGGRLLVDGKEVVNVDGVHPLQFKSGKVKLDKGIHSITAEYFEAGGQEELKIEYQGPGTPRQSLDYVVSSKQEDLGRERGFKLDDDLVNKGRTLFAKVGCASCHEMKENGKTISPSLESSKLVDLKIDGGCLGETPSANAPLFELTATQRSAIVSAIESISTDAVSTTDTIAYALATFNCYACHQRGDVGGVEQDRNALFKGNQPEMGDEGRIPPLLTGVGAKLQRNWITHVLNNGGEDRPYMLTRMPKFGGSLNHLAEAFEKADQLPARQPVKIVEPTRRLKTAGRQLVGSKGSSCIKCHTFGKHKATGVQSISMTTMSRRLKQDWFEQYLLNPAVFRPGTRMPAAWPGGNSFFPNILNGDARKQIHAVWRYLSDADKASPPEGLVASRNELVVENEAVIYRNFIEGSGPRAIGVGYPEGANLAFDANNLQVVMLWHGAFIDASRHWNGRGQGFQPPLGDNILRLPAAAPLAVLENADAPWPSKPARETDYRFRGYRLSEGRRPIFRYTMGDVSVEDYSRPASDEDYPAVRREIALEGKAEDLWFRAATGNKIEKESGGWYAINDDWRTKIESAQEPKIRKRGNLFELVVPVKLDGEALIVQEYSW